MQVATINATHVRSMEWFSGRNCQSAEATSATPEVTASGKKVGAFSMYSRIWREASASSSMPPSGSTGAVRLVGCDFVVWTRSETNDLRHLPLPASGLADRLHGVGAAEREQRERGAGDERREHRVGRAVVRKAHELDDCGADRHLDAAHQPR